MARLCVSIPSPSLFRLVCHLRFEIQTRRRCIFSSGWASTWLAKHELARTTVVPRQRLTFSVIPGTPPTKRRLGCTYTCCVRLIHRWHSLSWGQYQCQSISTQLRLTKLPQEGTKSPLILISRLIRKLRSNKGGTHSGDHDQVRFLSSYLFHYFGCFGGRNSSAALIGACVNDIPSSHGEHRFLVRMWAPWLPLIALVVRNLHEFRFVWNALAPDFSGWSDLVCDPVWWGASCVSSSSPVTPQSHSARGLRSRALLHSRFKRSKLA